jgi:rhodanese-related sulfurtransferase
MNTITVDELKARMDKGENINLVDVREPHERANFNIGGRHVPIGKIQQMEFDDLEDLKDKEVILYCRSGNRSGIAGQFLEQIGFKNTVNLTGGMVAWEQKFGRNK